MGRAHTIEQKRCGLKGWDGKGFTLEKVEFGKDLRRRSWAVGA